MEVGSATGDSLVGWAPEPTLWLTSSILVSMMAPLYLRSNIWVDDVDGGELGLFLMTTRGEVKLQRGWQGGYRGAEYGKKSLL